MINHLIETLPAVLGRTTAMARESVREKTARPPKSQNRRLARKGCQ
jgi:hypothetical protein